MPQQSAGCGNRLARWLATLIGAVVILILPVSMLTRAASQVVFSPPTMTRILDGRLIQSGLLTQIVVQGLFSRQTEGELTATDLGRLMTYAGDEQRQAVAEMIVPEGWAQTQLANVVQGLYAWLNDDSPAPEFNLDLGAIRENLSQGGVAEIVNLAMASWPACTQDQTAGLSASLADPGSLSMVACLPPEPEASQMRAQLTSDLEASVANIPDRLPSGVSAPTDNPTQVLEGKRVLRSVHLLSNWLWLVPAALLGLIVALAVRSWTGVFKWCGIPVLCGGVAGMALAAWASAYGPARIQELLQAQLGNYPAALQAAVLGTATDTFQQVVARLFVLAAVVGGLAGIIVLLGVLTPQSSARRAEVAASEAGGGGPSSDHPSGMFD